MNPTYPPDVSDQLTLTGPQLRGGGFANIHQAIWRRDGEKIKVCFDVVSAIVMPSMRAQLGGC